MKERFESIAIFFSLFFSVVLLIVIIPFRNLPIADFPIFEPILFKNHFHKKSLFEEPP